MLQKPTWSARSSSPQWQPDGSRLSAFTLHSSTCQQQIHLAGWHAKAIASHRQPVSLSDATATSATSSSQAQLPGDTDPPKTTLYQTALLASAPCTADAAIHRRVWKPARQRQSAIGLSIRTSSSNQHHKLLHVRQKHQPLRSAAGMATAARSCQSTLCRLLQAVQQQLKQHPADLHKQSSTATQPGQLQASAEFAVTIMDSCMSGASAKHGWPPGSRQPASLGTSAEAVAGFMRTAAVEEPAHQWRVLHRLSITHPGQLEGAQQESDVGVYGACQAAGLSYQPR